MIPRPALILGLAGLIPFLWDVATMLSPGLAASGLRWFGPRFVGPYVGLAYGTVILAFMSGVLWGFATRAREGVWLFYSLSVVPALWAFFFVGGGPVQAGLCLAAGFAGLLGLDWVFQARGLTPAWWMTLRTGLSAVVIGCLLLASMA
ncbi:DUF3429 family protein [bacterium]|nr:DUF3429 family protein [bacterium]